MTTPNQKIEQILTSVILLAVIFLASLTAYWAADRTPPLVLKSYTTATGTPGQSVVIDATVKRDLSRSCSSVFNRTFFDAAGARTELTEGSMLMNARALEEVNRISPDHLRFNIKIPVTAVAGEGSVMTVLDYECNPTHIIKPISMVLTMKVLVL